MPILSYLFHGANLLQTRQQLIHENWTPQISRYCTVSESPFVQKKDFQVTCTLNLEIFVVHVQQVFIGATLYHIYTNSLCSHWINNESENNYYFYAQHFQICTFLASSLPPPPPSPIVQLKFIIKLDYSVLWLNASFPSQCCSYIIYFNLKLFRGKGGNFGENFVQSMSIVLSQASLYVFCVHQLTN